MQRLCGCKMSIATMPQKSRAEQQQRCKVFHPHLQLSDALARGFQLRGSCRGRCIRAILGRPRLQVSVAVCGRGAVSRPLGQQSGIVGLEGVVLDAQLLRLLPQLLELLLHKQRIMAKISREPVNSTQCLVCGIHKRLWHAALKCCAAYKV